LKCDAAGHSFNYAGFGWSDAAPVRVA
jgi:hypothetical protein